MNILEIKITTLDQGSISIKELNSSTFKNGRNIPGLRAIPLISEANLSAGPHPSCGETGAIIAGRQGTGGRREKETARRRGKTGIRVTGECKKSHKSKARKMW